MFGGLPGAQATIRCVLIIKEGGTMRLAGMITGVFVILEMLVFQQALKLIPQAVFSGILFKIGYDVFDFEPFSIYLKWFVERILDGRRSVSDLQYHRRLCSVAEPARHTLHVGFVIVPVLLVLTTSMMFERAITR